MEICVAAGFEALHRGDMEGFDGMPRRRCVVRAALEVPDARAYEGRDAIEAMEDWPAVKLRPDLFEILDEGRGGRERDAASRSRKRERNRDGPPSPYVQEAAKESWRGCEIFFDREQALEAAGLSE